MSGHPIKEILKLVSRCWIALFISLSSMLEFAHAELKYYIIANHKVADKSLSKESLREIFMGKKLFWEDRTPIRTFRFSELSGLKGKILQEICQKSPWKLENHWRRQLFSGRWIPPISVASDEEMEKRVGSTDGGIGIVLTKPKNETVKVIDISLFGLETLYIGSR